jgi:hypothetical protein
MYMNLFFSNYSHLNQKIDWFGSIIDSIINYCRERNIYIYREREGKYSADVQASGLTTWVAELHQRNDKFDRLARAYNEQQAEESLFQFKDIRSETDEAYKKVTLVINALIIMKGETAYAPFVTELNTLIKHYNDLLAQHLRRNSAKKQIKNDLKN